VLRLVTLAAAVAAIGCGSKARPVVDEPEDTGPLTAAAKLAATIRDGGGLWWARDGVCQAWELDAEIDDDEGVFGTARRSEETGGQSRTVTYKISVTPAGEVSAIGPSTTATSQLGRTTTGGSASCTNNFQSAVYISDGAGIRLTSRAGDGGDVVLDERWYFSAEACQAGRGAKVTSGCGR
jgi:hypothetical protein